MSTKRNLPAWMVASDDKHGTEEQSRKSLKRKPEINTNTRVRRKCMKRMIYWMNEQELIDAALGALERDANETGATDGCAPPNTELTVIPETDHEGTTDSEGSEPALDIAEQETVSYSKCLEERRCDSSASKCSAEQRLGLPVVLAKEAESESDSDHEGVQVLRKVFFS